MLAVGPERAALLINVRAEASRAAAPVHRSSTPFSALSCQELRRSWSPGLAGVGYVKRHVASAVAGPGPPRLSNAGGAQAPIVAAGGGSLGGARPPHAPAVAVRLPLRPDGVAEHTDSDAASWARIASSLKVPAADLLAAE